jgi:hypothetical protein
MVKRMGDLVLEAIIAWFCPELGEIPAFME